MGDIKTRFAIEGEQQYKSAMTNAANAIKVLNSEQKLAKAQFQNTGNAEKYAAQQADILRQKIAQQQKAVKAAEQALKQLSDNGVAKSSRQYQQWQMKLNNAQTALTQMETELKNVDNVMRQTSDQADDTSTALGSIGKKVSFDAVINGIGRITDTLESAAQKAIELGTAIVNSMKDSASWADELATTATVYGYSTEELQRMRYTADILDTSTDAIVKSRQKLVNAMQSESETFSELGVSIRESGMAGKYGEVLGDFRKWEDVFWDLGDALTRIEKEKGFEYVNKQATQLLGKGWEQLKPIFNSDWASEDNYLGRAFSSARDYYEAVMASWDVVSDENVKKLTKLDDAYQALENNFETLKQTVAGELAPGFTDVTNIISGLLEEFNKYLASDEGKEKMQSLSDAVVNLFAGLKDVDFNTILDGAVKAIDGLTSGLEWIGNNWGTVKTGIEGLATAFGLLKVSETVLTFMQLLASGKFLFGGGGNKNSTSGAETVAGGEVASMAGITAGEIAQTSLFAAPFALFIDGLRQDKELVDKWMANARDSIAGYQANVEQYSGNEMFDIWDVMTRYTTVNGTPEDSAKMKEFAQHFFSWWNDEITDAGLEELAGGMSDEDFYAFKDALGKILNGELLYSSEDQQAFADALNKAIEAAEGLMNPVDIDLKVPDDEAASIAEQVGVVHIPGKIDLMTGQAEGEYANGLPWVPYDGYLALLHRGERVMTARENRNYTYNSNNYFGNVNLNNGLEIDALCDSIDRHNRRQNAGFGG